MFTDCLNNKVLSKRLLHRLFAWGDHAVADRISNPDPQPNLDSTLELAPPLRHVQEPESFEDGA